MQRKDGRGERELRPVTFERGYVSQAEGSVLISFGETRVLCTATVEDDLPRWMRGPDQTRGWITAEYAMLPRSTNERTRRERSGPKGRTQEIQRLIGRALRAAVDLERLGPRSIIIDCDVIQADGGTRTAAITGGFVALADALQELRRTGELTADPIKSPVAAVSVGLLRGSLLLDLCYEEDIAVDIDSNFVLNGEGQIIEFQGTAEGDACTKEEFLSMMELAGDGIAELIKLQRAALEAS